MTGSAPLLRAYRSAWLQVAGWFVVTCSALAGLDAALRAREGARLATVMVAVGAALVAWVWALRPVVRERSDALLVVNPLRTAVLPWSTITDVAGADVVTVTAGDIVVRCFAIPRSFRQQLRTPGAPVRDPYEVAAERDPIMRFESLRSTLATPGAAVAVHEWVLLAVAGLASGVVLLVAGALLMAAG